MIELLSWIFERPGRIAWCSFVLFSILVTIYKSCASLGPFVVSESRIEHPLLMQQEENGEM